MWVVDRRRKRTLNKEETGKRILHIVTELEYIEMKIYILYFLPLFNHIIEIGFLELYVAISID